MKKLVPPTPEQNCIIIIGEGNETENLRMKGQKKIHRFLEDMKRGRGGGGSSHGSGRLRRRGKATKTRKKIL